MAPEIEEFQVIDVKSDLVLQHSTYSHAIVILL